MNNYILLKQKKNISDIKYHIIKNKPMGLYIRKDGLITHALFLMRRDIKLKCKKISNNYNLIKYLREYIINEIFIKRKIDGRIHFIYKIKENND